MHARTQLKGAVILLITALIWGTSFVAQSIGMEVIDAFTYNGIRSLMGAAALVPFILVRDKVIARSVSPEALEAKKAADRKLLPYGLILGCVFCVASNFQQYAFYHSTAGKIAFITALYMFFTPLFGLFIGKKVSLVTWICTVFGIIGLYFLSIDPAEFAASGGGIVGFFRTMNRGDLQALACAAVYGVHILCVEKFSAEVDGVKLSCLQFLTAGIISCGLMFLVENPVLHNIRLAIVPLLYSGLMSCGIAYTLQIIGQKYTEATLASILMCMESVFAVLAAALILHERLTGRELLGCVIMFAAILLSQGAEALAGKKAATEAARRESASEEA